MGCWEESGFRGRQARRRDQPLQMRRAELAGRDQGPPRPLRNASTPRQIPFLVADDKEFQVFQVGLARLRFSSGISDVMVPTHCFSLSVKWAQILRCRYRI